MDPFDDLLPLALLHVVSAEQVTAKGDSAALVDDSTITASEVDADQNSTNFLKPVFEILRGGSVTNFVPEANLNNDGCDQGGNTFQAVSAEFESDPSATSSVILVLGIVSVIKPQPRVGNTLAIASASSNVMMEKSVELPTSCTNNFQSFQSCGDGSGGLNQSTSFPLPTSEILRKTDLPNKFDDTSSKDAVHNGTRDWPSSFGSSGEAADIFSGLESLNDFLTQAATDTILLTLLGNVIPPKYHTPQDSLAFNEAAVLNEDDTHTSNRSETEEIVDLNPARPGDDVFHYQSMKSGEDPTSGIPVHEELTNAADSPTLADSLHADVTREKEDSNKRKKDGSTSFSLRKNIISSIAGEEDKGGKTSSGGVSLHEAGAYDEEEFSCSEDGRDPYDDQANEGITSTSHLFNHQSLMKKAPRETWSKQDTQRFYEAVRTMGTAFSLLELLFPGKTPRQIKLKFNNEDGKYRSRLDDAVYNRAKDHSGDLWIEPVKLASTKAEEDPSGDASDFMMAEEVVDLTAGTNVYTFGQFSLSFDISLLLPFLPEVIRSMLISLAIKLRWPSYL
ncbi:hypothetical protein JHK87_056902 [Glycine soja]|nr:hypothetical protein JHK87_056902 [Glycine soja]